MELESANKELESYSYSISHDLRAPLRTLDGFSEMIIEEYGDKLDETGKNYLNRIRKAGQTMSQLTEDILKLSRITRAEMHRDKVNLSDMAGSIADELRAIQPERQAEFIITPDIIVNGDRALLQILLRNLLRMLEIHRQVPRCKSRDGSKSAGWKECLLHRGQWSRVRYAVQR